MGCLARAQEGNPEVNQLLVFYCPECRTFDGLCASLDDYEVRPMWVDEPEWEKRRPMMQGERYVTGRTSQ